MDFKIQCVCDNELLLLVTNITLDHWKKLIGQGQYQDISCPTCGCTYDASADKIGVKDKSKPRLDKVTPLEGSIKGGKEITLKGHALDIGKLSIFFGNKKASIKSLSTNSITVTVPPGELTLNEHHNQRSRIRVTEVKGLFHLEDILIGQSTGAKAALREFSQGGFVIDYLSEGTFITSEVIKGSKGKSSAVISDASPIGFHVGEDIKGDKSKVVALLSSIDPLKISEATGYFTAGEEITGIDSGAKTFLDKITPFNNLVDIRLENEFGCECILTNAFKYIL